MSAESLQQVLANQQTREIVKECLIKKVELDQEKEILDTKFAELYEKVKALGLKQSEFIKFCKFALNEELLNNELAFLDLVNQIHG